MSSGGVNLYLKTLIIITIKSGVFLYFAWRALTRPSLILNLISRAPNFGSNGLILTSFLTRRANLILTEPNLK